jgi:hypothetical protein
MHANYHVKQDCKLDQNTFKYILNRFNPLMQSKSARKAKLVSECSSVAPDVLHVAPDVLHVAPDVLHVAPDVLHVAPDVLHVAPDVLHVAPDVLHVAPDVARRHLLEP